MQFGLFVMQLLLFVSSVFMILLVLVQRGRGGGLAGALGGAGGQSAFGSKAGDVFTRITVGTAIVWIMLSMLTIQFYNPPPRPVTSQEGFVAPGDAGALGDDDGELPLDADDDVPALGDPVEDPVGTDGKSDAQPNPSGDGQFDPAGLDGTEKNKDADNNSDNEDKNQVDGDDKDGG